MINSTMNNSNSSSNYIPLNNTGLSNTAKISYMPRYYYNTTTDKPINNLSMSNKPLHYRRRENENRAMNDDRTLHDGSVEDYEREVKDLVDEFRELSKEDRKKRLNEFIKKEGIIFAKVVDNASRNEVSRENLIPLIYRRNEYLKEIHRTKETCPIT